MNIKIKEVKQLKINDLEGLDPITVYMDEWEHEKPDRSIQYQGRVTIVCYDTILSYYWGAMGEPLKDFLIDTNAEYLAGKFIQSSYSSYCPVATVGNYTENGVWREREADVNIEMSENQKEYIIKVIKAVQSALKELKTEEANEWYEQKGT